MKNKKSILSIFLGILAIVLCRFGIIPLIIGIIGIILGKQTYKESLSGKIGLLISSLSVIITIVVFVYLFKIEIIPAIEHAKALANTTHK